LAEFRKGDHIDACDTQKKWYLSLIDDVSPKEVRVHYAGWPARWDEWIPKESPRLAPQFTYTMGPYLARGLGLGNTYCWYCYKHMQADAFELHIKQCKTLSDNLLITTQPDDSTPSGQEKAETICHQEEMEENCEHYSCSKAHGSAIRLDPILIQTWTVSSHFVSLQNSLYFFPPVFSLSGVEWRRHEKKSYSS